MHDLVTGLALVLVVEGSLWCLFPGTMRKAAARAALLDPAPLRVAGLFSVSVGVLVTWLIRG